MFDNWVDHDFNFGLENYDYDYEQFCGICVFYIFKPNVGVKQGDNAKFD